MLISHKLTNNDLTLFMETDGRFYICDHRTGVIWNSLPLKEHQEITGISASGSLMILNLKDYAAEYQITIELTQASEIVFTIDADSQMAMEELNYPQALVMPRDDYYILETDSEGLLLPVTDQKYPTGVHPFYFCGGGACMSWIGVVDRSLQSGYMITVETPYDAALNLYRENGLLTFSAVWLSSMQTFRCQRRVRYTFFESGGYVAQCKHYRNYIWEHNNVLSLKQKEQLFPNMAKLPGAVHVYIWNTARTEEFVRKLKASGVDRAMLLWDPNHYPYPPKGFDLILKESGYATGAYDLFTDIINMEATDPRLPLKPNVYPGKYEELAARKSDHSVYTNQYGTYLCPEAVRDEMEKRIVRRLADYPHETYFLDVYCANGVYECYNPDHPLTRGQYAEAIIENMKMMQTKYGQYIGSEFGADYGAPYCVYFHGMMTLQRTWFNSEVSQKGTIYCYGDWSNNPSPSVMTGTHTASGTYMTYSLNEYTRVPLYELVYHDAVITSWRWEDGNASCPEIWWKKDLFNILYGTAPLWNIDEEHWDAFSQTYLDSYHKISPWLREIQYDEMVSHKFVTQDHTVQESAFSSGRHVIVNFGPAVYDYCGDMIPAGGFLVM